MLTSPSLICKCPSPATHSLHELTHHLPSTYEAGVVSWGVGEIARDSQSISENLVRIKCRLGIVAHALTLAEQVRSLSLRPAWSKSEVQGQIRLLLLHRETLLGGGRMELWQFHCLEESRLLCSWAPWNSSAAFCPIKHHTSLVSLPTQLYTLYCPVTGSSVYNSFKVKAHHYTSQTLTVNNENLRSLFQTLLLKETLALENRVPLLSGKKDIQKLLRAFLCWSIRDLKTLGISVKPLFIFRNKIWSLNLEWPKWQ